MTECPIVTTLRSMGFSVEGDGDVYTVSDGRHSALLELTDEESKQDSLRTIEATFGVGIDIGDDGRVLNLTHPDTGLAYNVAGGSPATDEAARALVSNLLEDNSGVWDTILVRKGQEIEVSVRYHAWRTNIRSGTLVVEIDEVISPPDLQLSWAEEYNVSQEIRNDIEGTAADLNAPDK